LLPRDVVRDLLGIARALYVTRKADGATAEELAKLEGAGKELGVALELSRRVLVNYQHADLGQNRSANMFSSELKRSFSESKIVSASPSPSV
jgi:hypothetical protein